MAKLGIYILFGIEMKTGYHVRIAASRIISTRLLYIYSVLRNVLVNVHISAYYLMYFIVLRQIVP